MPWNIRNDLMVAKTNEASVMLYQNDNNLKTVRSEKSEKGLSAQANGIMQKTKTGK